MDTKKKVNPPNKVLKGIKDPLAITMARQVIHRTNVGVMQKKNSMVNVTIAINMVKRQMNVKRNQNLKENVTNARNKVTRHQTTRPSHSI